MKGKSEDRRLDVILIVLLFFIFMIVFVTLTGCVYYFYRDSDTLLAGIIAFVGAVIGGTITLVGVNKTLLENRRRDRLTHIPEIIKIIEMERQFIFEFQLNLHVEEEKRNSEVYTDFLRNSNSELIKRINQQNILSCGEELYTLYQKIISGSFDLFMITAQIPLPEFKPKIRKTGELFERCTDFVLACDKLKKKLEKEYFGMDKNL